MIKTLIVLAGFLSASVASSVASTRTLTSADGSKTVVAEIKAYNPNTDKVLIRQDGSDRDLDLDASSFSVGDRVYFHDYLLDATKREALKISVKSESDRFKTGQGSIYIYMKNKEHYTVSVNNSGLVNIENLTAKYEIYSTKYSNKGEKFLDVVSGEASISSLPADYTDTFETKTVEITRSCATTSSCPTCVRHAASVKKERVMGIHVRLYDDKGELINEFHSSSGIKHLAEKTAKES